MLSEDERAENFDDRSLDGCHLMLSKLRARLIEARSETATLIGAIGQLAHASGIAWPDADVPEALEVLRRLTENPVNTQKSLAAQGAAAMNSEAKDRFVFRKDDSGHTYIVPAQLTASFDVALARAIEAEDFEAETCFEKEFGRYRTGRAYTMFTFENPTAT